MNKKFCVYTVLFGDYEILNEQPLAKESQVDFICFTDNKNLSSESWKLKYAEPVFPFDLARSSRVPKICPHRFLSEYESSLYIDNSIVLKKTPEVIFNELLEDKTANFVCMKHSYRETVLDEFIQVARLQFDDLNIIMEQLNTYYLSAPDIIRERPLKGGFLFRKHNQQEIIETMEEWLAHVLRYSRRDQLSLNYILHKKKLQVNKLDIDVANSEYFFWPVVQGRDREKYKNSGMLLKQLLNEVGEKDQKNNLLVNTIAEKERKFQALELKMKVEKEYALQVLEEELKTERELAISSLEKELRAEREQILHRFEQELKVEKEKAIRAFSELKIEKESIIYILETELAEIKRTISWRVLQPFRKIWSLIRSRIFFRK